MLYSLWDAARKGDANKVRQILMQHHAQLPSDTAHPVRGSHLVLEIAAIKTSSQQLDEKLRDVLLVLSKAGWNLFVRTALTQENALHRLVKQDAKYKIQERMTFFIQAQMKLSSLATHHIFTDQDWTGNLPEQSVSYTRRHENLPATLRTERAKIQKVVKPISLVAKALFWLLIL